MLQGSRKPKPGIPWFGNPSENLHLDSNCRDVMFNVLSLHVRRCVILKVASASVTLIRSHDHTWHAALQLLVSRPPEVFIFDTASALLFVFEVA